MYAVQRRSWFDKLTTNGDGPFDRLTTNGDGPFDKLTTNGDGPFDRLTTNGDGPFDKLTTNRDGPFDKLTTNGWALRQAQGERLWLAARRSMARASMIFVPVVRLRMPMDSSVPWARLSIGSSSGSEPEKP